MQLFKHVPALIYNYVHNASIHSQLHTCSYMKLSSKDVFTDFKDSQTPSAKMCISPPRQQDKVRLCKKMVIIMIWFTA